MPAAPTTPAIITIAATARPPRHRFAASTRNGLGRFQIAQMLRTDGVVGTHHFRKRSALGRAAMVRRIAPKAPISMMAAASSMTVAPWHRPRDVLTTNEPKP